MDMIWRQDQWVLEIPHTNMISIWKQVRNRPQKFTFDLFQLGVPWPQTTLIYFRNTKRKITRLNDLMLFYVIRRTISFRSKSDISDSCHKFLKRTSKEKMQETKKDHDNDARGRKYHSIRILSSNFGGGTYSDISIAMLHNNILPPSKSSFYRAQQIV